MNRMFQNRPVRSGFTLIELLVVIAIIAILAAILFPVFATAREKARQTSCLSNMKQINLAAIQYIQDFDETWPQTYLQYFPTQTNNAQYVFSVPLNDDTPSDKAIESTLWAQALYPYIKTYAVYVCPSAKSNYTNLGNYPAGEDFALKDSNNFRLSYPINGYLNTWPMAMTQSPANVISFSEGFGDQAVVGDQVSFPLPIDRGVKDMLLFRKGSVANASASPNTTANCTSADAAAAYGFGNYSYNPSWWVHNSGSNYAYMDGHVKYALNPSVAAAWAALPTGKPKDAGTFRWATGAVNGCATWYAQYGPSR